MQSKMDSSSAGQVENWRVFLSYRRNDTSDIAEWLYARLKHLEVSGKSDVSIRLDPYLDRAAPSVGDFRQVLIPYPVQSRLGESRKSPAG